MGDFMDFSGVPPDPMNGTFDPNQGAFPPVGQGGDMFGPAEPFGPATPDGLGASPGGEPSQSGHQTTTERMPAPTAVQGSGQAATAGPTQIPGQLKSGAESPNSWGTTTKPATWLDNLSDAQKKAIQAGAGAFAQIQKTQAAQRQQAANASGVQLPPIYMPQMGAFSPFRLSGK
jgi:hypothetical protein